MSSGRPIPSVETAGAAVRRVPGIETRAVIAAIAITRWSETRDRIGIRRLLVRGNGHGGRAPRYEPYLRRVAGPVKMRQRRSADGWIWAARRQICFASKST